MDYISFLLNLVDEEINSLKDSNKYEKYISLLNKIKLIKQDNNESLIITDEEINFIGNENIINLIKSAQFVFSKANKFSSLEEHNNVLNTIYLLIEKQMSNDKNIQDYLNQKHALEKLKKNILNNMQDEEKLFLFVKKCYEKGRININTAVNLNIFIAQKKNESSIALDSKNDAVGEEIIEINENNESIKTDLVNLFSSFEYNYDLLDSRVKKHLETYAKIDNVKIILSFLKENNINMEQFLSHQKTIGNLIVYYDIETLNKINNFIKNNSCSLNQLLQYGTIFLRRKRKFKFKNKSSNPGGGHGSSTLPRGEFESFMDNIELYKIANGLPIDHKMTDDDFTKGGMERGIGMANFFLCPKEKIEYNRSLLKKYKIVDGDNLPSALVSLTGKNTEYILDRCIESGIYGYAKKFNSIMALSDFPFRWFKIKRAIDLHDSLMSNTKPGLRTILKSDILPYSKIDIFEDRDGLRKIKQEQIDMGELVKGNKMFSFSQRERMSPEECAKREFELFYEYKVGKPLDIFRYVSGGKSCVEKGSLIEFSLNKHYDYDINNNLRNYDDSLICEDEYIKLFEDGYYEIDGERHNYKLDDLTYEFYSPSFSEWPSVRVRISRLKVLKLCKILKKDGYWLNDNMSKLEKENIILSVLLKDTIISRNELSIMRKIVSRLLDKEQVKIKKM